MQQSEWVLKRNCSLSPRQFGMAYLLLCVVTAFWASFFTLNGAPLVMAFAMIELLLVGGAFLHHAIHAADHDRVVLDDRFLMIEYFRAGDVTTVMLERCWVRVSAPRHSGDQLLVQSRDKSACIGSCINGRARKQFARELGVALRSV